MKTVGIVADNYKLTKFKKELVAEGFADFSIVPFTPTTSTIKIKVTIDKISLIHKICKKVEIHFQRGN